MSFSKKYPQHVDQLITKGKIVGLPATKLWEESVKDLREKIRILKGRYRTKDLGLEADQEKINSLKK